MVTNPSQQLQVVQYLRGGSIRKFPLNGAESIHAEAGARYAVVDVATGKTPDDLQVKRNGESLFIESEVRALRVEIADFYRESDTVFVPHGQFDGETLTGVELTHSAPVLSTTATGDSIVWSAGSDTSRWATAGLAGLGAVGVGVAVGGGGSATAPDTTAPAFSSITTATALNENSGAGQTVYTAVASDAAAITYSLKAVGDAAAFSINASTGAVTLTGNPDFETQSSYSFTVVATDAAGNASEQAISLGINDLVDEIAPNVSSVAITSATGVQNSTVNVGDVLSVTVTLDEATVVTGTPQIALNIGGSTVQANYASGSGSTALVFTYTVQSGQTDANGISIGSNSLSLNGGTLRDAAGNAAVLTHGAVADNANFLVDTTAPTLNSSTPSDNAAAVAVGDNIVLTFNENVFAGSGNIVISNGAGDTRTIAVGDPQVSIVGNQVTINPTADFLNSASYNVQMASGALRDAAGNAYAGISNATTLNFDTASSVDTSIVVFDLLNGVSSDHSSRTFQAGTAYTIYIRVDSNAVTLDTTPDIAGATWGTWSGANSLGVDDRIVLVGSGAPIIGFSGAVNAGVVTAARVQWRTSGSSTTAANFRATGNFQRHYLTGGPSHFAVVDLWAGTWAANPNIGEALPVFLNAMPGGVLTSQGLT